MQIGVEHLALLCAASSSSAALYAMPKELTATNNFELSLRHHHHHEEEEPTYTATAFNQPRQFLLLFN